MIQCTTRQHLHEVALISRVDVVETTDLNFIISLHIQETFELEKGIDAGYKTGDFSGRLEPTSSFRRFLIKYIGKKSRKDVVSKYSAVEKYIGCTLNNIVLFICLFFSVKIVRDCFGFQDKKELKDILLVLLYLTSKQIICCWQPPFLRDPKNL